MGLFLGYVPLHVVLIWPLFILGEHRYLRSLCSKNLLLRAGFCFIDTALLANLVEIYCVSAGLWSWKESNCLGVPFFGILGWALFATPAVLVLTILEAEPLELLNRLRRPMVYTQNRCLHPLLLSIPFLCMVVLHLGLFLLWNLGKKLSTWELSASNAAVGISIIQLLYHCATKHLSQSNLRIADEVPRLLACGIVASLWLLKGHFSIDICLVTMASLLRLLAFEFWTAPLISPVSSREEADKVSAGSTCAKICSSERVAHGSVWQHTVQHSHSILIDLIVAKKSSTWAATSHLVTEYPGASCGGKVDAVGLAISWDALCGVMSRHLQVRSSQDADENDSRRCMASSLLKLQETCALPDCLEKTWNGRAFENDACCLSPFLGLEHDKISQGTGREYQITVHDNHLALSQFARFGSSGVSHNWIRPTANRQSSNQPSLRV